MKKLIFFIPICCLLYSCNEYDALPQDKIPLLKNNDSIYFHDSISSKVDTFRLDVRNIWHQDTEGNYLQYIEIYYDKLNQNETLFSIYISTSGTGGEFSIFSSKSQFQISNFINYFTMHGVTYPNVYITQVANDTIPSTVYFTYSNGIIRYKYNDGRVYQLVNK